MTHMTHANVEPLFVYQDHGADKIVRRRKTAVIAPMGSGKTRLTCEGLRRISSEEGEHIGPILIVCSGPAVATWVRQFPLWYDCSEDDIHIVTGTPKQRQKIWELARSDGGVFICNPAVFRIDFDRYIYPWVASAQRPPYWGTIICDEYHKYMRWHKKNQTFDKMRRLVRHVRNMILVSGSYYRKDPSSLWTTFVLMDEHLKTFRSFYRFRSTFCVMGENYWGGQEVLSAKNVEALKGLMDQYLVYIPEEVVADQLPQGLRSRLYVTMTEEQARIYEQLVDDLIVQHESGQLTIASTRMTLHTKLRQLLCCPKILDDGLGYGAGFEAIADKLTISDDPHAIIFCPFRKGVEYVAQGLREAGFKHVYELMGGTDSQEQQRIVDEAKAHRGIIVCTVDYGESFDFETCSQSYFLGYSYSLDQNRQCEGRTRRAISSHAFVTWQYIAHMDTIDMFMLESLGDEEKMQKRLNARPAEYIQYLRGIKE